MTRTGIVVLAHGSRGERGKGEVEAALKRIAAGLKPLLAPGTEITGAALQFNQPCLEEAVAALAARGVERIVIAPYFLFPGRHITEHVPQAIAELQRSYTGIRFLMADNLGLNDSFIGLIAERIREAAPDLALRITRSQPGPIERESMKIVASRLPPLPDMSDGELAVVKRVVHASGDVDIARLLRFSDAAVSCGLSAIAGGSPIFTDVRMLQAGIDSRLAQAFGCSVSCALDEVAVTELAGEGDVTRTAAAIASLDARLQGSIVAIGNAPTALLSLLDLIDGGSRPALVVGMPVGFVRAGESKEALMKRNVPYVTIVGTRGGSAMAAATVNALLRLAQAGDSSYGTNCVKSNLSGGVR